MRRLHPRLVEAAAVAALLAAEGVLFARNLDTASSSDEGVYLASLDALRHGERLGSEVFASQPPAFYLVLRVIGLFAGHSLEAARIGFLLVALVGCAGAYALGRALGGIAAGLAAAGLIAILPPFASEAMRVDADVPAVSITLVALALVAWATHRNAPRWLAVLAGAVLVFALLVKLDAAIAIVPFAALLLSADGPRRRLAAYAAAGSVVVAAAFLIVYAGVLGDLWESVVAFHRDARSYPTPQSFRYLVRHEVLPLDTPGPWLVLAGLIAAFTRNRRALPLWTWPLAAALLLWWQKPLFEHHLPLLCAALGAAAGASFGRLPRWAIAVVLAAIAVGAVQQFHRIGLAVTDDPKELAWGSVGLHRCPAPVASDQGIVAFDAQRRIPGQIVDTSNVRFATGSLTPRTVLETIDREHVTGVYASRSFLTKPAILAGLRSRFGPPRTFGVARVWLSRACAP